MRLLNGPLQTVIDTLLPESVFDFWLEELGALHRKRRVMARVVERFPETPEMITLVLQPNGHFQGFQPGSMSMSRSRLKVESSRAVIAQVAPCLMRV